MHNQPLLTALCIAPGTEDEFPDLLPDLLMHFDKQDYPAGRRELVIIDDGPQDLQEALNSFLGDAEGISVHYRHSAQRLTTEEKIALALSVATGEYIHFMAVNSSYPADWFSRMLAKVQQSASCILGSRSEVLWLSPLGRLCSRETHLDSWSVLSRLCCRRSVLETRPLLLASNGWEASFACEYARQQEETVPVIQCHTINEIIRQGLLVNTRALSLPPPAHPGPEVTLDCSFFYQIVCISRFQQPQQRDEFRAFLAKQLRVAEYKIEMATLPVIPVASVRRLIVQLEVLKMAQARQWNNVLMLDDDIQFVNDDSRTRAVNQVLSALKGADWKVVILSAHYQEVRAMTSSEELVSIQHATAIGAYAVNSSYYSTLIDFFEKLLNEYKRTGNSQVNYPDSYWHLLQPNAGWLGVWPPLAFPVPDLDDSNRVITDNVPLYFRPRLAIDSQARSKREAPLLNLVKQQQATRETYNELASLNRELQRDELAGYYEFKAIGRLPEVKQDTSWPLLSVIIPTYNQVAYLKETLESIRRQSYPNLEIIVADDCSTDGTQGYMKRVSDARLVYVRHVTNLGVVRNLVTSFNKHSHGEYNLFIAHDDLLVDQHYLWNAVQVLENDKELSIVFSNYYNWHETNNIIARAHPGPKDNKIQGKNYFLNYGHGLRNIQPLVAVYRRECLINAQAFEFKNDSKIEDIHMILRAMLFGDVAFIPVHSAIYRLHQNSITFNLSNDGDISSDIAFMQDMEKTCAIAVQQGMQETVLKDWIIKMSMNHFANWRLAIVIQQGKTATSLAILAWMNKYYPSLGRAILTSLLIKK